VKVLSVDTSSPVAAVALTDNGKTVASFTLNAGNTHSVALLPMIKESLDLAGVNVCDIDLFGCTVGPGSFTGVRIGVSTVKGLAIANNTPCVGVSSIESAALPLSMCDGAVVPVLNARRGNVYTAIFTAENGVLTRQTDDLIIPVTELCEKLKEYGGIVYFTGDACDSAVKTARESGLCAVQMPDSAKLPRAEAVCAIAERVYGEGDKSQFTAASLSPKYLRPGHMGSSPIEV